MKLPDVNLLLYASNETTPRHTPARHWWELTMSGSETVAFSWVVMLAFLRITTRGVVMKPALTPSRALDLVDSWLAQPCATIIHPTRRHSAVLRDLLTAVGTAGNRTTDAHLAALAIEHGATLCSADADFSRFPGLDWIDPLRD